MKLLQEGRKYLGEEYANRWILSTLLLNTGDAVGTYFAVTHGASEMNPVMAAIIKLGMGLFFIDKLLIVNFLILSVGLVSKRYLIGRAGLMVASLVYAVLILWHVLNLCILFMTNS